MPYRSADLYLSYAEAIAHADVEVTTWAEVVAALDTINTITHQLQALERLLLPDEED
jgi:hypothetical protein